MKGVGERLFFATENKNEYSLFQLGQFYSFILYSTFDSQHK